MSDRSLALPAQCAALCSVDNALPGGTGQPQAVILASFICLDTVI